VEESRQPEQDRYAVDAEATLVMVSPCGDLRGRLLELGMEGCRVRVERACGIRPPAGVEAMFRINGMGFRLAGRLEHLGTDLTAQVRFSPMAPRRHEALLEILAELAEGLRAPERNRERNQDRNQAAAGRAAVIAISVGPGNHEVLPAETGSSAQLIPAPICTEQPSAPAQGSAGFERRAQSRHSVDTGATIFLIDVRAQISGRIVDLSLGGCRIRTHERFPVGIYRRTETEFKLDGLPFRLGGVIQAVHDKFTVGIRFLDMSSRKKEQLELLMQEIEEERAREQGPETSF